MVNKRVKTKLIVDQGNRMANPTPGVVLDHSITGNDIWDFYLVSTNCKQGVPTPTHYSVLHDNIPGNTPEKI